MNTFKFHQGDVIGSLVDNIPSEATQVNNKPIALGSSNHVHILTGNVFRYELGERVFFEVKGEKAVLQHTNASNLIPENYLAEYHLPVQDHNPIELKKGFYEFWIQKAYNPFKKKMEEVKD